jgi:hypothetical protein
MIPPMENVITPVELAGDARAPEIARNPCLLRVYRAATVHDSRFAMKMHECHDL